MFGKGLNLDKVQDRGVFTVSSINENKINKLFSENQHKIIDFHRLFFSRIFPKGSRVDSSNYNPIVPYLCGS